MSLHHVSLATGQAHFKEMRDFYLAALQPLGYKMYLEKEGIVCGLRGSSGPDLWLHCGGQDFPRITEATKDKRGGKPHVAFAASGPQQVNDWYKNAIKLGAISNGPPGVREAISKDYYTAFVLDPLGNNIEVVYYSPLWLKAIKAAPWVITGLIGGFAGIAATAYFQMG